MRSSLPAGRPSWPNADTPQQQAYLQIRLEGGAPTRRPLTESHVVIGRLPGVQILLDHHTVSRRHAEMYCDPFGRFWIRDLGSTNGTMVGGEAVTERALAPGDRITIGDFHLVFNVESPGGAPEQLDISPDDDDQPTAIRRLVDLEPPRIAAGHLRTLLELSRKLLTIPEPMDRADALCDLVARRDFHAIMAVVLRTEGRRSRMLSRPHWAGPEGSAADARQFISRRVLDMLRVTREPVLATNTTASFGMASVEMSIAHGVGDLWVIAVPFRMNEETIDVLYATVPRDCGSAEWLSLYALAAEVYIQGEATWAARMHAQAHAAIERELETARQIQHGLVPRDFSTAGIAVAIGFQPCKWVGGDYVDVVPLPRGRALLAVADVCGKGIQAALVGSALHTMVRAAADVDPPLSELIERVNRYLCEWLPEHSFVTMVAVVIDPATGELECLNAGHPPMLIVSPSGKLTELQVEENPALGMIDLPMVSQSARIEPGDILAMYTDGLTELMNTTKEMLGIERLAAMLVRACAAHRRAGIAAVGADLDARLDAFRGDEVPGDDRTYLLAQRR